MQHSVRASFPAMTGELVSSTCCGGSSVPNPFPSQSSALPQASWTEGCSLVMGATLVHFCNITGKSDAAMEVRQRWTNACCQQQH